MLLEEMERSTAGRTDGARVSSFHAHAHKEGSSWERGREGGRREGGETAAAEERALNSKCNKKEGGERGREGGRGGNTLTEKDTATARAEGGGREAMTRSAAAAPRTTYS